MIEGMPSFLLPSLLPSLHSSLLLPSLLEGPQMIEGTLGSLLPSLLPYLLEGPWMLEGRRARRRREERDSSTGRPSSLPPP
jgi:hypothetical protein